MKVLHVPFCYFPDPLGGTEVYTAALVASQKSFGMTPVIAAPASRNSEYRHEGIPVHRYRTAERLDLRDQYGAGDREAAAAFDEVLERVRPDVVHLHAHTSSVSLRSVRAAKKRGIPVVFTYHTPTVTCQRGTLLEWGAAICDGAIGVRRCSRCALQGLGLAKPASWFIGSVPPVFGAALSAAGLSGSVWTALKMTELCRQRGEALEALFAEVDEIVAVCLWVKELLIRNGVPDGKITLCRQGLANCGGGRKERASDDGGLRVGFFGRLDQSKGVDTLIEALRLDPELKVRLDIFAVVQSDSARRLKAALILSMGGDSRIQFLEPAPSNEVVERLRGYDALAAPSRCLETGPLVVYEAFAAGVPVIGSNLGGIAELVEHETNGLLVASDTPRAWASAFRRLAEDSELRARLKQGIPSVRTMEDAAREMQPVYKRAVEARAA